MPYIKQERKDEVDSVVENMVEESVGADIDLFYILYEYCDIYIEAGYNSYKNYCGELTQCANEIERRLKPEPWSVDFNPEDCDFAESRGVALDIIVLGMDLKGIKADGDLNYILYKYCKYNIESDELICNFCDVLRATAKHVEKELLAPYEDMKIKENGDV